MARFTYALGKWAWCPNRLVSIRPELVNLHCGENVAEEYLLSINPKGQVPALAGPGFESPLTDSLDISYWLCDIYPGLLPNKHDKTIRMLLTDLHNIQALSLSVKEEDRREGVPCSAVDALLGKDGINPKYRLALQYKRDFHRNHLEFALEDSKVASAEAQAKQILASVAALLSKQIKGAPWLFGVETGPTVLDAHIVPFIMRLMDCGRNDLVLEELQKYAEAVTRLPPWQDITHGRSTIWDVSIGHVHLLHEI